MRHLYQRLRVAVLACSFASTFLFSAGLSAAVTTIDITGNLSDGDNNCTQITLAFTTRDCSYGNTRRAQTGAFSSPWQGFSSGSGFYTPGSTGDDIAYTPGPGDAANGRIAPGITGTISIDDNDTPGNADDDIVNGNFVIGAAVRNTPTGQTDRITEAWSSYDHTMAPTPVNAAVDLGAGTTRYIIAADGVIPADICSAGDPGDCFPTDAVLEANGPVGFWPSDSPSSNVPSSASPSDGVGIARSTFFASGQTNPQPGPPFPAGPAFGAASTTAVMNDYVCTDNGLSNDCNDNVLIWNNPAFAPIGQSEDPGWDNLILVIDVDAAGDVVAAQGWWTQEYFINFSVNDGSTANSWSAGTLSFTGECASNCPGGGTANDDEATTSFNTTVSIDILDNDDDFTDPVSVFVLVGPSAGGTTQVLGSPGPAAGVSILYTPVAGQTPYVDTFTYQVSDGFGTDTATVTVDIVGDAPVIRTINIGGNLADSDNGCWQLTLAFTSRDCSYGNTRRAQTGAFRPEWQGFGGGSGFYTPGSTGDDVFYRPQPGDVAQGRIAPAITGLININDNGTPGDALDDLIEGEIVIGAAVRNAATGQTDRVTESWSSYVHTLAPTAVNDAVDLGGGTTRYIIAANGELPAEICSANDPSDCFPSDAALEPVFSLDGFWPSSSPSSNVGPAVTPSDGVGIARSRFFASGQGLIPGPPFPSGPAFGAARTTAVMNDYVCTDTGASDDCNDSVLVWNNPASAPVGQSEDPGWDNLILWLDVSADGDIVDAGGWWTQEWFINFSVNDGQTDNSWSAGTLAFTGTCSNCQTVSAEDDNATTAENVAVDIDILANDLGLIDPVSVQITAAPSIGTAQVNNSPGPADGISITYTPSPDTTGIDTLEYQATDANGESDTATVTITVEAAIDSDSDGIADDFDNCINVPNGPLIPDAGGNIQLDADGDLIGNACDADFDNDGEVSIIDAIALFFTLGSDNAFSDLNGNGVVDLPDYIIMILQFGGPPGPSGLID